LAAAGFGGIVSYYDSDYCAS